MPRRSVLSAAERAGLLSLPEARDDLIRTYALSESDLRVIRRHGEPQRRLDVTRAQKLFGFRSRTMMQDRFRETIRWYLANRAPVASALC